MIMEMTWLAALRRVLAEARQRRALAELDARTLKDIGLAQQAEERERLGTMRATALRFGIY